MWEIGSHEYLALEIATNQINKDFVWIKIILI